MQLLRVAQHMIRKAGVMVIFDNESQSLILTQRSKEMPIHPGEVSFPGGRCKPHDENTKNTAFRETEEEIGIKPERLHIIRPLDKVLTLTGYEISPYLAEVENIKGYHLQAEEVEKLIRLPISNVMHKQSYQTMVVERRGAKIETLRYAHQEYLIWGATAKIMLQLVDLAF